MNNQRVYQTTYQSPDKKINTGYIIDGKTYTNPQGTERVPTGSTVHTAGGDFLLTEVGGVKLPGSVTNDVRRAYDSRYSQLGAGYSAQKNAINTATRRNQARIAEQRKSAATQYGDSNRAAYQAYMSASNPYGVAAEQQAKLGLANSGYSETSKLRTANTYQQALSQNALARDAYLRELDNAYREAQYDGDIQLANALANYQQLVYQHGINAAEAIANQENAAYNAGVAADRYRWERDIYEREQAIEAEERARRREIEERDYQQTLWNNAYKMAQAGFSNADIAKILGISLGELNRFIESMR